MAHGNWIRDAVLFTAVRHLGHRLAEVYREIPGLKYPAAAAAVKRFGRMRIDDRERARFVGRLRPTLGRWPVTRRLGEIRIPSGTDIAKGPIQPPKM